EPFQIGAADVGAGDDHIAQRMLRLGRIFSRIDGRRRGRILVGPGEGHARRAGGDQDGEGRMGRSKHENVAPQKKSIASALSHEIWRDKLVFLSEWRGKGGARGGRTRFLTA